MAPLPLELPAAPPVLALAPVPALQRALVWALLGLPGPAWALALALALPTWLAPLLWLPLRAGGRTLSLSLALVLVLRPLLLALRPWAPGIEA